MAGVTINGKSLDDVAREFAAPFDTKDIGYLDGHAYAKPCVYYKRLEEAIGLFGFDVEFSQYEMDFARDEQEIIVKCRITIYDDNGVGRVREAYGANNIIYPKIPVTTEKGEFVKIKRAIFSKNNGDYVHKGIKDVVKEECSSIPKNVANDVDSACQDAFKRACKRWGIGRFLKDLDKKGGKNTHNGHDKDMENVRKKLTMYNPVLLGDKGVKVLAREEDGLEVVFWKDVMKRYSAQNGISIDWFDRFFEKCNTGYTAVIIGTPVEKPGKPKQIYFQGFGK